MSRLINRAKASCNAAATGAVTPGAAVAPYRSWSAAGAAAGMSYPYLIEQGVDWEIGVGLYNGTTITRPGPGVDVEFDSSTGALLNVTAAATIACVANRSDYPATMNMPVCWDYGGAQLISRNTFIGRFVVAEADAVIQAVNFLANAAQTGSTFYPAVYSGWDSGGALIATGPGVANCVKGVNNLPCSTTRGLVKAGDKLTMGMVVAVADCSVLHNIGSLGSVYFTPVSSPPSTMPGFSGTNAINNANCFLSV